ncbi:lactate racemase domain-containing protein [Thalassoroseus pseudoceratinae]|uniref:lactate racemase domain-containing protein n=1 Tax=Thalassoroseus pseudoceratinae TaxID=2713176 RepID=UPI001421BE2F|nr:lactate racemase domain-containing protein [Thalassoroseus pseudoceratinae]
MSTTDTHTIVLEYGAESPFRFQIEADRVVAAMPTPESVDDVKASALAVLQQPLDFPPLSQSVIPDDHVVLAVDPATPDAASLVAACWVCLEEAGISAENVLILETETLGDSASPPVDPRRELPEAVRARVQWKRHRPGSADDCAYLATTAAGERIYLAPELVHADAVITIGLLGFDPLLGYRGTNSVFYPGLSTAEAVKKSQGQGHQELRPNDERPLRQLVDEIGWLLGTLFTLQVIPSVTGGVSEVLAGALDSVLREGKKRLDELFRIELDYRAETVVVSIGKTASDPWQALGAALAVSRNLVGREGKVVLLSSLDQSPQSGVELLQTHDEPLDILPKLQHVNPDDREAATQLAKTLDWAGVYLLSGLPDEVVEELGVMPIGSTDEVERLLAREDQIVFIPAAIHSFGRVRSE